MTVLRWKIRDPHDTNVLTNTYTFPMNPREMSSPFRERSIQTVGTTRGRVLLFEGSAGAKSWQFSGPILNKAHMDALLEWVYERRGRVIITDHFGRQLECVLQAVDFTPKRRIGYYYSHEYSVTALITKINPATVPNAGPI